MILTLERRGFIARTPWRRALPSAVNRSCVASTLYRISNSSTVTPNASNPVLLALYVLKRRGHDRPRKARVLNFISWNRLMHVPADDSGLRSTGDEIWENDLAWKRANLKEEGLTDMPK